MEKQERELLLKYLEIITDLKNEIRDLKEELELEKINVKVKSKIAHDYELKIIDAIKFCDYYLEYTPKLKYVKDILKDGGIWINEED